MNSRMEKLAAAKDPLPYANRLQISTFLGKPADSSLMPRNLAMLQGNFAISPQQSPQKPAKNTKRVAEMKTASAVQTPFQGVAGEVS